MILKTTEEWDKVFSKREKVRYSKVGSKNHFGIELAADLHEPREPRHVASRDLNVKVVWMAVEYLYCLRNANAGFIKNNIGGKNEE